MKRRIRKVLNFFAFNLLFFALYLNFIHKDKNAQEALQASHATGKATMLVKNSEPHSFETKAVKQSQGQIVATH
jgi:hypothetical protein